MAEPVDLNSLVDSIGIDAVKRAIQERICVYEASYGHSPKCLFISANLFYATIAKCPRAWGTTLMKGTFLDLRIFMARPFGANPEQTVILEVA